MSGLDERFRSEPPTRDAPASCMSTRMVHMQVYVITVRSSDGVWETRKRFRDFRALDKQAWI